MIAPTKERLIHADPSKSFFIDMLTRDIGVIECIMDLVDNAVDKAVERAGVNVMTYLEGQRDDITIRGARIDIDFSEAAFQMRDTCGGISVVEARDVVFRFGNPEERGAEHGLSVYGIGMKRAFFKLGDLIIVESETDVDYFKVTIDVPDWKAKTEPDDWYFEFDEYGAKRTEGQPGTVIRIPQLRSGARDRLRLTAFQDELVRRLESTYALFLTAGVELFVNGAAVKPRMPTIVAEPFKPAVKRLQHGAVNILIIASLSPRHDRTAHGWYVFCNGRMVLEADKGNLTGWGDPGFVNFHSKFNHFVGLVYFQSRDVRLLPWRTTKQGVEKESPVFQAALSEMRIQAKPVLDFLTSMYPVDLVPEGVAEREALDAATAVDLPRLPKGESSFKATSVVRKRAQVTSIQFSKPKVLIKKVAESLGDPNMPASRVGESTFEYYVATVLED